MAASAARIAAAYATRPKAIDYVMGKLAAVDGGKSADLDFRLSALAYIPHNILRNAKFPAVVLIHDGVRPLITPQLLRESIEVARNCDGALVAVPAKDTIKVARDGIIIDTPLREMLWQAQTPQSFRFATIYAAHRAAELEGFTGTDDASLVERRGGVVRIVRGDYRNIKITTPEDLILAEAFLAGERKEV